MPHQIPAQKFLIVDDSHVDRVLLGGLLRRRWPTCEILEASDGAEGLVAVEQEMPDLVLTELRSGGMELLAALRDKQCLTPVVVVSGIGSEEIAVAVLQAGAASYVPKRSLPTLLVSTVTTVFELSRTHHNRRRIIGCLRGMDLRFDLANDCSLASPLVRYLADHIGSLRLCDEPDLVRISVALHEALSNAIQHGNLELDSELRQEEESLYYEMAQARKLMWPYCDRRVHVLASLEIERTKFVIRDDGPGFNHRKVIEPMKDEDVFRIGGRGMLLIRSFMDEVHYNDCGNEITLVKYTTAGKRLPSQSGQSPSETLTACLELV